jgi:uncharacterized protein (DUF58 family)
MTSPLASVARANKSRRPPAPWRRQLRFTREGKYFVALTLGIGFAAINTGNNLLYLMLSMLLALIVGSGVLSEQTLRKLTIARQLPQRLFAGQPVLMGLSLHNDKRWIPSFSIEVQDLLAGQLLDKKCYFLKVPAGRTQKTSYRHVFERRGRYVLTGFRIATRFPFSLFRKSRDQHGEVHLVVYPTLIQVEQQLSQALDLGEEAFGNLGHRGEFYALRHFRETDDPRDIHWRKSAQLGIQVVRQDRRASGRRLLIVLENRQTPAAKDELAQQAQEHAVSQAASIAAAFIEQGVAVGLITRTSHVRPDHGQAHLDLILHQLALLEFVSDDRPFAASATADDAVITVGVQQTVVDGPERSEALPSLAEHRAENRHRALL